MYDGLNLWNSITDLPVLLLTISPFAAPKEAIHTESGRDYGGKKEQFCNGKTPRVIYNRKSKPQN